MCHHSSVERTVLPSEAEYAWRMGIDIIQRSHRPSKIRTHPCQQLTLLLLTSMGAVLSLPCFRWRRKSPATPKTFAISISHPRPLAPSASSVNVHGTHGGSGRYGDKTAPYALKRLGQGTPLRLEVSPMPHPHDITRSKSTLAPSPGKTCVELPSGSDDTHVSGCTLSRPRSHHEGDRHEGRKAPASVNISISDRDHHKRSRSNSRNRRVRPYHTFYRRRSIRKIQRVDNGWDYIRPTDLDGWDDIALEEITITPRARVA